MAHGRARLSPQIARISQMLIAAATHAAVPCPVFVFMFIFIIANPAFAFGSAREAGAGEIIVPLYVLEAKTRF
jgi:hypothetical protein